VRSGAKLGKFARDILESPVFDLLALLQERKGASHEAMRAGSA
jgi:hypothetical protein